MRYERAEKNKLGSIFEHIHTIFRFCRCVYITYMLFIFSKYLIRRELIK